MPKKRAPRKMVINGKTYQPQQFIPNAAPDPMPLDDTLTQFLEVGVSELTENDRRVMKQNSELETAAMQEAKRKFANRFDKVTDSGVGAKEYQHIYLRFQKAHNECIRHGVTLDFGSNMYPVDKNNQSLRNRYGSQPFTDVSSRIPKAPTKNDIKNKLESRGKWAETMRMTPKERADTRERISSNQRLALVELRAAAKDLDRAHAHIRSTLEDSDLEELIKAYHETSEAHREYRKKHPEGYISGSPFSDSEDTLFSYLNSFNY